MKILRLTVNWILFLSMPLWAGTLLFFTVAKSLFDGDISTGRVLATGKDWIWE